jgi:hypothetical protein
VRLSRGRKQAAERHDARAVGYPGALANIKNETKSDIFHWLWLFRTFLGSLIILCLWHSTGYIGGLAAKYFRGDEAAVAAPRFNEVVVTNDVSAYEGPSYNSRMLGAYKQSSRLRLIGEEVNEGLLWKKVEIIDGPSKDSAPRQGWVSSKAL